MCAFAIKSTSFERSEQTVWACTFGEYDKAVHCWICLPRGYKILHSYWMNGIASFWLAVTEIGRLWLAWNRSHLIGSQIVWIWRGIHYSLLVIISNLKYRYKKLTINKSNRSFSSDVTAAILVYQNNEIAAILVYGTGISSFLFKYFVLFHHPTGATDHVSENDLYTIDGNLNAT
jgi:hypothetical protein